MADDETDQPRVVCSEPTPDQLIRQIHCWIATYPDGTEGIIATDAPGYSMLPLLSSRQAEAQALEGAARKAGRAAERQTGHKISVRLVTYTSTEHS
jgi:hypothetical protein